MATHTLSEFDLHLLSEGKHFRSFEKLGAHPLQHRGTAGVQFAVWAPHALDVSVIGDFNGWDPWANRLERLWPSNIWVGFVPHIGSGARYKYSIVPAGGTTRFDKADPYAVASEAPPGNASRVWDLAYPWGDAEWMATRTGRHRLEAPIAIYEVHLGSWMRVPEQGNRRLTYRELAPKLTEYAGEAGFTHVQFLPIGEHSGDATWGYEPTGLLAPTARHGTPQDLMWLVDALHGRGIGVILDWSVSRLSGEAHGLIAFDGQPLYEVPQPPAPAPPAEEGPKAAERPAPPPSPAPPPPLRVNLRSPQVANLLIAGALYWIHTYHADGLRVARIDDLLYPRPEPARGGNGPLARVEPDPVAVAFLRQLTDRIHAEAPGVLVIADDTSYPSDVTRPTAEGGLGFDLKWDRRWTRDVVEQYMCLDPLHRKEAHAALTASVQGARGENRILPLDHEEVGGGRPSFLSRMPGDDWHKFANLRLLLGFQATLPGKKLLFMGTEFGQWSGWNHAASLDWHLLHDPRNAGLRRWVRDLNTQYRALPALHAGDCRPEGFAWVDLNDREQSVVSFVRRWGPDLVLVVCNFTPVPRHNYRVGVPRKGTWQEVLNGDAQLYGGSGHGNMGGLTAAPVPWHGQPYSLNVILPPLAVVAFLGPKA